MPSLGHFNERIGYKISPIRYSIIMIGINSVLTVQRIISQVGCYSFFFFFFLRVIIIIIIRYHYCTFVQVIRIQPFRSIGANSARLRFRITFAAAVELLGSRASSTRGRPIPLPFFGADVLRDFDSPLILIFAFDLTRAPGTAAIVVSMPRHPHITTISYATHG